MQRGRHNFRGSAVVRFVGGDPSPTLLKRAGFAKQGKLFSIGGCVKWKK